MYGQGPMQLGVAGSMGAQGLNPQQAQAQQLAQQQRLQQEAAQRAQLEQVARQRMAAQAQQQQAVQGQQQQQLQATQPVRDNPAMQQMVDVARAQDQQGQQQAPQQPGFMQQSFAQRMQNPYIQALLMGGMGMAEAGSRGEGPMQAFLRGGAPMGIAALQGAQSANEQDAKDAEQQRRDDEMYELQRRALEQRIQLGMPASGRVGRMQSGVGGGYS